MKETQVKVNPHCELRRILKNFRILVQSYNGMYWTTSLKRAKASHKAVSRRKRSNFNRWHSKWAKEHVSDVQHSSTVAWFMGKSGGQIKSGGKLKAEKIKKSKFV